jgi:hypothetical protein
LLLGAGSAGAVAAAPFDASRAIGAPSAATPPSGTSTSDSVPALSAS